MRLLILGLVTAALALASADRQQQTASPQQTQASSDNAAQKPAHKIHVKKGSRDDINAIGKRKMFRDQDWYSLDKEIELGKGEAKRAEEKIKLLDDTIVNEYINRLGQNLVRNSDTKIPVTIKVVDSPEINAFSVAGGYVYVNSGMVLDCANEAELAGVMAHVIAHLAARHQTRLWTHERLQSMLESPKLAVISDPRSDGATLMQPMAMMKFHREFEMEADYFGIQYLYKSGYDPMAFVARLERNDKDHIQLGSLSAMFAEEPLPAERICRSEERDRKDPAAE